MPKGEPWFCHWICHAWDRQAQGTGNRGKGDQVNRQVFAMLADFAAVVFFAVVILWAEWLVPWLVGVVQ